MKYVMTKMDKHDQWGQMTVAGHRYPLLRVFKEELGDRIEFQDERGMTSFLYGAEVVEVDACNWCGGIGFAITDGAGVVERCDLCDVHELDDAATNAARNVLHRLADAWLNGCAVVHVRGVKFRIERSL